MALKEDQKVEDIIDLNICKSISDGKLSKEIKDFIADLTEAIIIRRFDKAAKMIARLKSDDNNSLDAMAGKLHILLDLIGGY